MKLLLLLFLLSCSHQKPKYIEQPPSVDWKQSQTWEKLAPKEKRIILILTNGIYGNPSASSKLSSMSSFLQHKSEAEIISYDLGNWVNSEMTFDKNPPLFKTVGITSQDLQSSSFEEDLKNIGNKSIAPLIVSNTFYLKTAQPPEWKNISGSQLIKIKKISIGFINILSRDKLLQKPSEYLNGFYLEPTLLTIIRESRNLRNRGAHLVVVAMPEEANLSSLINQIPSGLVDLVITDEKFSADNREDFDIVSIDKKPHSVLTEFVIDSTKEPVKKSQKVYTTPVDLNLNQFLGESF